jgi:putative redox protein
MGNIDVVYQGNLKCRTVNAASQVEVLTAIPADGQGNVPEFSPTDLVAVSLGSCVLTMMGMVAERHGIAMSGARCTVASEMTSEPVRRIGAVRMECSMPAEIDISKRLMLEKAAATCPVKQSLHPDIKIEIIVRYPD